MLSFVEFLYFFTFRLWNNIRTGKKSSRITSFRLSELGRRRNSRMMQLMRNGGVKLDAGTTTSMSRRMSVTEVKPVIDVSLVSATKRNAKYGGGFYGELQFHARN